MKKCGNSWRRQGELDLIAEKQKESYVSSAAACAYPHRQSLLPMIGTSANGGERGDTMMR